MTERLSKEQEAEIRDRYNACSDTHEDTGKLLAELDALRAERDSALAQLSKYKQSCKKLALLERGIAITINGQNTLQRLEDLIATDKCCVYGGMVEFADCEHVQKYITELKVELSKPKIKNEQADFNLT